MNKRYKHYPMFRVLELDSEIEKLEQKAKRYTYKGIPTKKRQKLEKLYQEASHNYRAFMDTEKGLNVHKKGRRF